jgi:hypothetical protein
VLERHSIADLVAARANVRDLLGISFPELHAPAA